jgi:hypothetical protein
MDQLEKIFKENRDQFDHAEPEAGHFNRFREKIDNKRPRGRKFFTYLKAASIALLVVLSSLWMYDNLVSRTDSRDGISLGEISPEYRDAEIYYTRMVESKYDEIDNYRFPEDTIQKEILRKELSDMDVMYKNLQKELQNNPKDERLIHAMIEHYELKIDVMNQILDQLKQIKDLELNKDMNHEKTNI